MKKLAICLHIYYKDQLDKICSYLGNIAVDDCDLFVSFVKEDIEMVAAIKKVFPQAHFFLVKNKGYDIGPFIEFLHKINIDDYEYVLKLHTKGKRSKNYTNAAGYRMDNALWGRVLWDSMLKGKGTLIDNLSFMDKHKDVGMLGSKYCLVKNKKSYLKMLPEINEVLVKIGKSQVSELSFVAGSMFLVRASCLKPLLQYRIDDFAITDGSIKEGTLAHVMERVFGVLGGNIVTVAHGKYFWEFLSVSLKRFFYQKKDTLSGKQIIKICKIPIWRKG